MIRVFRIVTPDGEREHWATHDEAMHELARLRDAGDAWGIEVHHRALKRQCGGAGNGAGGLAQRNHIGMAIRAFVRLEWHRVRTGIG